MVKGPLVAIHLQNFVRIQEGAEGLKNRNRQSHAWAPLIMTGICV
jgi:hypothetical protein